MPRRSISQCLIAAALLFLSPALAQGPTPAPALAEDDILQTLIQGEALRAVGDYAGLLGAAENLRLLGANPVDGQGDVAIGWIEEARAHGVTRAIRSARGRALGPGYRRGALPGGESLTIRQVFLGGQPARVALATAGKGVNAELSVAVRDTEGRLMCGGGVNFVWQPAYSGRVDIEIANAGDASSDFYVTIK